MKSNLKHAPETAPEITASNTRRMTLSLAPVRALAHNATAPAEAAATISPFRHGELPGFIIGAAI
jgi:hypothetical protein